MASGLRSNTLFTASVSFSSEQLPVPNVSMFTDTGPAVEFNQTERDTLETGLRLALAKFGPSIRLRGGDEAYRHAMADIAADKGLYVEFSDKGLQERYEQRRKAIKAGRAYMAQAERAKPAQGGPGRTAEPEKASSYIPASAFRFAIQPGSFFSWLDPSAHWMSVMR